MGRATNGNKPLTSRIIALRTRRSSEMMLRYRSHSVIVARPYYVYGIFRNGSALFTVIAMADQLEVASRGPEYYLFKHAVSIVVHFLLLLYFLKGNVLEYFGLATLSKWRAIGILVGLCSAITLAMSVIGMISD